MSECLDWDAWYNRMPGREDPRLHIVGKIGCSHSTTEIALAPANKGVHDDPELFVLHVTITEPEIGDNLYHEVDVEWAEDAGQDIKRVEIRGDCSAVVEVKIVVVAQG
jgi:hypothetical protein